ncbi:MAG: acetyl-coenzyme A synthetase N-terminal domain-containing protein, partial [Acidobacteriota bacterium]
MNTGTVLWSPPADVRERTRIGDYLRWLKKTRSLDFTDYDALWSWSVTELEDFWQSVWDYFDVRSRSEPTMALIDRRMPGARWFSGATLNYAEHALRHAGEGLAI